MYSKKHVIAAAPLVLSLAAFTQEALAVTDITACRAINTSGSFRLTKNLSANGDCLVVTANEVEIDLQGHTIRGNGTTGFRNGTGFGVRDNNSGFIPNQRAITLHNGTIANFATGVSLERTKGAVVEQLRVVGSGVNGIALVEGRVQSNVVFDVGGTGIFVDRAGVVSDNFVSECQIGIFVGSASTVVGNSVRNVGQDAVSAGCPSRVTDNAINFVDGDQTDAVTGVAIQTRGPNCSVSGNASSRFF